MATVNSASLRDEFDGYKADIDSLRKEGKISKEADVVFRWRTHNFVDFTFIFDTLQKNSRQENSMARSDMRDFEWDFIEKLLPNKSRGVKRVDDRRVINGILYALRTGIPWRDMPEQYGPWSTIYNRFNRWSKAAPIPD